MSIAQQWMSIDDNLRAIILVSSMELVGALAVIGCAIGVVLL